MIENPKVGDRAWVMHWNKLEQGEISNTHMDDKKIVKIKSIGWFDYSCCFLSKEALLSSLSDTAIPLPTEGGKQ